MGILRKAAIGTLVIGLGAAVAAGNKKAARKIKKAFERTAKTVAHSAPVKKARRWAASKKEELS